MTRDTRKPTGARRPFLLSIQLAAALFGGLALIVAFVLQHARATRLERQVEQLSLRIEQLEQQPSPAFAEATPARDSGDSGDSRDNEWLYCSRRLVKLVEEMDANPQAVAPDEIRSALNQFSRLVDASKTATGEVAFAAAKLYSQVGQFDKVIRWCHEASGRTTDDSAVSLLQAQAHYNLNQYEQALQIITTAPEPPVPALRLLKGKIEFALGRDSDARQTLEPVMDVEEVATTAATLLARHAIERGDRDRANELVERAVELGSTDIEILQYSARMMLRRGQFEECIALVTGLLRDETEKSPNLLRLLAEAYIATQRASLAVEILSDLVVASPLDPSAHEAFGRALLAMHRPAEAATQFTEASRLNPDDQQTWFHLGVARANNEECDASTEALDRAIELNSQHAPSHFARAVCLARLHNYDDAQASLQRALALDAGLIDTAGRVEVFETILAAETPGTSPTP